MFPAEAPGTLKQPLDRQVVFRDHWNEIPPGDYLLYQSDDATRGMHYISLDGSTEGLLFHFDPPFSATTFIRRPIGSRVVGMLVRGPSRTVVDLAGQSAYELEPLCHMFSAPHSPGAIWLGLLCDEVREPLEGHVTVQIVDLETGSAHLIEIPFEGGSLFSATRVYWVTDDSFVAQVGKEEAPCLVTISTGSILCATTLVDTHILSAAESFILLDRVGGGPIKEVYSTDCFGDATRCEAVGIFDTSDGGLWSFRWSPDGTKLAIDVGDRAQEVGPVRIGYYDLGDWAYHEIGTFAQGFGLLDWCPDGTCLVIFGAHYSRASLDGKLERLPIFPGLQPLGVVRIP